MPRNADRRFPVLLTGLIATVIVGWIYWQYTAERRNAERIISALDTYRTMHGRFPDPKNLAAMKKLGFKLRAGWHPDYQLRQTGQYCLIILKGFDGPYWIYDSHTQKWCRGFPNSTGPACARCSKS